MRFARMAPAPSRRLSVAGFSGGLDLEKEPELIGEDQLSACRNMYDKGGELVTRPGFVTAADRVIYRAALENDREVIARFTTADGGFSLIQTAGYISVWDRAGRMIGSHANYRGSLCRSGFFAEEAGAGVLFFGAYSDGACRITRVGLQEGTATFLENQPVYVPLAFINARPSHDLFQMSSGGSPYEGFNLLTPRFRSLWTPDGKGLYYSFPTQILPPASLTCTDETGQEVTWQIPEGERSSEFCSLTVDGEVRSLRLAYNYSNNCLWLEERVEGEMRSVALPQAGYGDGVSVTATRADWREADAALLYGMGFSLWFGGTGRGTRLFVSGNGAAGNLVRYSDVNRPTFFPENNYLYVGQSSEPVTAFSKQDSCLVIFKPREIYACQYAWSATSGEELAAGTAPEITSDAWFPLQQIHSGVGCDCPDTVRLCGNRLVWANRERGRVYTLTYLSDREERAVADLSGPVAPALKRALQAGAVASLWEDRYLLLCGGEIFLFNYRTESPAWYRWEFDRPFIRFGETHPAEGVTLLGEGDSLMLLASYHMPANDAFCPFFLQGEADSRVVYDGTVKIDGEDPVTGSFSTKAYSLGEPHRYKKVEGFLICFRGRGDAETCWVTDRETQTAPRHTRIDREQSEPVRLPCRLDRVRRVTLQARVTGCLRVGASQWTYRMMGEVK